MAFSLSDIKISQQLPPRILIYGAPGVGKTRLACGAPKPVVIPIEAGFGKIKVPSFSRPEKLEDIFTAIEELTNGKHEYETLIIDGPIESLIHEYVIRNVKTEKGVKVSNIHGYGFHKGFDHSRDVMRTVTELLNNLAEARGMAVILIAHAAITHIDSPTSDPYDRFSPDFEKKTEAVVRAWADAIFFYTYEMSTIEQEGRRDERRRAVGSGKRILITGDRPAWVAKNRYDLPLQINVPEGDVGPVWSQLLEAMADGDSAPAQEQEEQEDAEAEEAAAE